MSVIAKLQIAVEPTIMFTAALPPGIKAVRYVKNHHFIELEDDKGNKTKLNASALLVGSCTSCKETCFAASNQGSMTCTHCGGAVKWAWSRPQLSFIPEHESEFMGVDIHKNKKK
jgi:hypothetical protein